MTDTHKPFAPGWLDRRRKKDAEQDAGPDTLAALFERFPEPWRVVPLTGNLWPLAHVHDAKGYQIAAGIPRNLASALAALPGLVRALESIRDTANQNARVVDALSSIDEVCDRMFDIAQEADEAIAALTPQAAPTPPAADGAEVGHG